MDGFFTSLEETLDDLPSTINSTICLTGDFNAKNSSWWSDQSTNDAGTRLANLTNTLGLFQLVSGPTRAAGTKSAAQLDLMFINNVSVVESCNVLPPISDQQFYTLEFSQIVKVPAL